VKDLYNLDTLAGTLHGLPGTTARFRLNDIAQPVDPHACRALFDRALEEPGLAVGAPLGFVDVHGAERWIAVRMANLLHDPHVEGVVINLHDVTEHRRALDDLEHLALHDALTGLANRTLFGDRIEQALLRSTSTLASPAVLFLDLDRFKTVNDSLGHDIGDQVLIEVARRLQSAVRPSDTVSRLGGDEFAVLIEENHYGTDEAETTADRLQQAMSAPFAVGVRQLVLSTSIGVAVADHGADPSSLLRDADIAMYRAKAAGRGQSVTFDTAMGTEAADRLTLEADLGQALSRDQFEVVYQPVIELQTERLVGFEALLRWNHPTRGAVMPDQFIPIAEETGAIVAIGRWVLDTACQQLAEWRRSLDADAPLTVAVNVSARQLASRDLIDHVTCALETSGLEPSSLVLEMTETALISDTEVASLSLRGLRELGVRLAIDDFGTGYSSLSYLRQFPIDILKIDRSFTETIQNDRALPSIMRGLLDLGRTLGLDIVAEGIELDVQREWLKKEHCKFGQGFLFAQPLTAADATNRIERALSTP
jgi:diguanylate cyclase (GGDEF)-like protein